MTLENDSRLFVENDIVGENDPTWKMIHLVKLTHKHDPAPRLDRKWSYLGISKMTLPQKRPYLGWVENDPVLQNDPSSKITN